MQRRRMGMEPIRVKAVWILAGIQQQPDDICVAVLRGKRQGHVATVTIGDWKQPSRFLNTA